MQILDLSISKSKKKKIQENKTLKDIQNEFREKFPFLRLEFFAEPHQSGEVSSKRLQIDNKKTVNEVCSVHLDRELSIHPNKKISTLESNFEQKYEA